MTKINSSVLGSITLDIIDESNKLSETKKVAAIIHVTC